MLIKLRELESGDVFTHNNHRYRLLRRVGEHVVCEPLDAGTSTGGVWLNASDYGEAGYTGMLPGGYYVRGGLIMDRKY